MRYGTHVLGGILAGALINPTPQGVLLAGMGSLIPDIDEPNSYLGKRVKLLSVPVNRGFGHRTLTHSPLVWGLIQIINLNTINNNILAYLIIGIFSHIILDMFNPTGVPIFYPISKKKTHIGRIVTGSNMEKVFSLILSVLIIVFIYKTNLLGL